MESLISFDTNIDETEYELMESISQYQRLVNGSMTDQANHNSLCALINCYLREIVIPANEISIESFSNIKYLRIIFPIEMYQISFLTDKVSLSGFYNICSPVIAKDGQNSLPLDYLSLLTVINHKLSNEYNLPLNLEIMLQAKNSLENISKFIKYHKESPVSFISNEQGLTFGHEFHPTPKARYGLNNDDLLKLSPEIYAKFKLHYFRVPKNLISCQTNNPDIQHPSLLNFKDGYVEYPIHPWQAKFILNQKPLCEILDALNITSIGEQGVNVIPTSSVRTLFNNENDYLYKYSLHVRLTNCLRKNSYYELENALKLSNIIKDKNLTANHPNVSILYEPIAYTVDIPTEEDKTNLIFKELFGLILRENISLHHQKNSYVALKLFSRHLNSDSVIKEIICKLSQSENITYEIAASLWFRRYAEILFHFIFDSYGYHGVIFEPHLQNIVLYLENNLPKHIYIRDLEGTKLYTKFQLENNAIYYDADESIRRIIYCLIINNFATAIHYLSNNSSELEQQLWRQLYDIIHSYKKANSHLDKLIKDQLNDVLNASYLPYKANLLTRYFKRADKDASYIKFPNPLKELSSKV